MSGDDPVEGLADVLRVLKKAAELAVDAAPAAPPTSAPATIPVHWPTEFAKLVARETRGDYGPYSSSVVELARAFLDSEARAVRRETELLDRIRRLETERAAAAVTRTELLAEGDLTARVTALERRLGVVDTQAPTRPRRPATARASGDPSKEAVADAVWEILSVHEPASLPDLLTALRKCGLHIQSATNKPEAVLATMLWRSRDRIVRTTQGYRRLPGPPDK